MKNSIGSWLWSKEIPDIPLPQKWYWLERLVLIGFCVLFPITFITALPGIFLGFSIGDEYPLATIVGFFETVKASHPTLFPATIALLVFHIVFRIQQFVRAQLAFKTNEAALPIKTIMLFTLSNLMNIVFAVLVLALLGMAAMAMGYRFSDGFNAVSQLVAWANMQAMKIPTIVELPMLVIFFVVYMAQGFVHYWIHRLCHTNRFLWLVLHRFHHMPDALTPMTTTVVITTFPLFLFIIVPKVFIFAAISKLFYAEPLYLEIFFLHLILWLPENYGHESRLYQEGKNSLFIRVLSFLNGNGVYHYVHHTNDRALVLNNQSNMLNIAGGLFLFWDKVFGTYQPLPDQTPSVGLWGSPKLHHNPVRLLASGVVQIMYELKENKDTKTRLRILFGSIGYRPPVSKSFHTQ